MSIKSMTDGHAERPSSKVAALARLGAYRVRREALHDDVRAAKAAGATHSEIAEASGLSRTWVIRITKD